MKFNKWRVVINNDHVVYRDVSYSGVLSWTRRYRPPARYTTIERWDSLGGEWLIVHTLGTA